MIDDKDEVNEDLEDQQTPAGIPEIPEEELYDKDGKPLPWSKSKRFQKIYAKAKIGEGVIEELKSMGIEPKDVKVLRNELGRLAEYDRHLIEFQERAKSKDPEEELDEDEKKQQKHIKKLREDLLKMIPELGSVIEFAKQQQSKPKEDEIRATAVAQGAKEHMTDLLEQAGLIDDETDDEDKEDLLDEWERRLCRVIAQDEDDAALFRQGSKKVITKHFKVALEKYQKRMGVKPKPKGADILNLPPRIGGPRPTGVTKSGKPADTPKTVREAGLQMAEEMRAAREK